MKNKSLLFTCIIVVLYFSNLGSFNSGILAQSIDVQNYDINLNLTKADQKEIKGITTVNFKTNEAVSEIELELYDLNVDGVSSDESPVKSYEYKDRKIKIIFNDLIPKGEKRSVVVNYSGKPSEDPKGFGGFFFKNNYAFNIGITMSIFPHNAGKMWFPCVDNFTDKAVFSYKITVPKNHTAVCGGTLQKIIDNSPEEKTYHWTFRDSISTYLASVAVGEYEMVSDTFDGKAGKIPINIYVYPNQKDLVNGTFKNLKQCLNIFENKFGPYMWERVGYVSVPFNAGAMEHACNISYPGATVDGGTRFETLWAHELSHSWFGNLVTCKTAEDMWLNEGFARYSEVIFEEGLYGKRLGKDYLRDLHAETILTAHKNDGQYYPVSGIPHDVTYGSTVYEKGATVAHSLRNTMGDSIFFSSLRNYFKEYAFGVVNSEDFRIRLEKYSGQNLKPFFDGWVYKPGYAHFEIDSFTTVPEGDKYRVTIYTSQQSLKKDVKIFNQPIEIGFWSENYDYAKEQFLLKGEKNVLTILLDFIPSHTLMDPEEKLCDATVDHYVTIKAPERIEFVNEMAQIEVKETKDSTYARITNHFVTPDFVSFEDNLKGLQICDRYWTAQSVQSTGFKAQLRLMYSADPEKGYDLDWFKRSRVGEVNFIEDSIVLLYRPDKKTPWSLHPNYKLNTGFSNNDLNGSITAQDFVDGEYTLAYREEPSGIAEKLSERYGIEIFPNPSSGVFHLENLSDTKILDLKIFDLVGKKIPIEISNDYKNIYLLNPSKGIFSLLIMVEDLSGRRNYQTLKIVVQ